MGTALIAIEGASYSGKSTLARRLQQEFGPRAIVLPDYVEAAGGSQFVPSAPAHSAAEQMQAFRFFLELDAKRYRRGLVVQPSPELVIMDRSIHTLLAHNFAMMNMMSWPIFEESTRIAQDDPSVIWPHLVLYVDVPQDILGPRYPSVTPEAEWLFTNPTYNRHFRAYFVPMGELDCTEQTIDGSLPIEHVVQTAIQYVRLTYGARANHYAHRDAQWHESILALKTL